MTHRSSYLAGFHAARKPRITCHASELEASERFCTCCERPLKAKVAWLELDQRTDTYHDRGNVPSEKSQGWFPFGMTCAQRLRSSAGAPEPDGAALAMVRT